MIEEAWNEFKHEVFPEASDEEARGAYMVFAAGYGRCMADVWGILTSGGSADEISDRIKALKDDVVAGSLGLMVRDGS